MDRRSIIHLSDLHFGRHSDQIVEGVFHFLGALSSPLKLVIVTGDLTQRAKASEFRHAAEFLQKLGELGASVVVIPGNHDVSLYNPYLRFLKPFRAYDQHIGSRFPSSYEDDTVSVLGLRTNDLRTVAEGRLTRRHAEEARARFAEAKGKLRLLAVHHPLLESLANPFAREILGVGPEMVLSGHRHRYGIVKVQSEQKLVLSLSAGTAISTRTREEENGFNWIEFSPSERRGEVRSILFKQSRFEVASEEAFSWGAPDPGRSIHRHEIGKVPQKEPAAGPLRTLPGGKAGFRAEASRGGAGGRKEEQREIRENEESVPGRKRRAQ